MSWPKLFFLCFALSLTSGGLAMHIDKAVTACTPVATDAY